MEGIEKIAQRIQEDARQEAEAILRHSREQADSILEQCRAQAGQEEQAILERGRRSAQERLERLSSAAALERRKQELAARQEMIGQAFDLALERLCSLSEAEYVDLLAGMAAGCAQSGREQLIFSPADRARVGKQVVMAANERLIRHVAPELPGPLAESPVGPLLDRVVQNTATVVTGTGLLTLSEETRPMRGGFVLSDGEVEVNCTFEALVRAQRERLEREVAEILFAGSEG